MRVLVNFQHNDVWWAHCIAEDARTPITPFVSVASEESLIRLLGNVGATDSDIASVREDIRRWNRGSVFVELVPGRKNLLRIRLPWAEQLDLSR
jgi:hypothetical protein